MKLLVVKGSPRGEMSLTNKLLDIFLNEYKTLNPNDEVKILDLYEIEMPYVDGNMVNQMFTGEDNYALKRVEEFLSFDKVLFVFPFWNLSMPAIVKSYIDYIVYVGKTFAYTEEGPVGLVENMTYGQITTRGGLYNQMPAMKMDESYLDNIMGFMHLENKGKAIIEGSNVLQGEELEAVTEKGIQEAKELARNI